MKEFKGTCKPKILPNIDSLKAESIEVYIVDKNGVMRGSDGSIHLPVKEVKEDPVKEVSITKIRSDLNTKHLELIGFHHSDCTEYGSRKYTKADVHVWVSDFGTVSIHRNNKSLPNNPFANISDVDFKERLKKAINKALGE